MAVIILGVESINFIRVTCHTFNYYAYDAVGTLSFLLSDIIPASFEQRISRDVTRTDDVTVSTSRRVASKENVDLSLITTPLTLMTVVVRSSCVAHH